MSNPTLLQRINALIRENEMQKKAQMRKAAAQPPMAMDPSMMGGMPPMDPSMMGGGGMPPMDPSMMGGMPPVDPSMMGGMPPVDPSMAGGAPAAAPAPAPEEATSTEAAPAPVKKLKPDEYMAKLDTRLYNLQVQVAALMKKLNVEVPPEALIIPASDQEQNLDNPNPQLLDVGSGGSPEEGAQESVDMGLPQGMELPPEMGGDTPKVASYRGRTSYNPSRVAAVISGLKRLY